MLRADHALRLSEATQQRYAACGDSFNAKERVTKSVQQQVVREFGFSGCEDEGLDLLRSAMALFPGDAELIGSAFYLKHNIHVPCPLPPGGFLPSLQLTELRVKDGSAGERHALDRPPSPALCPVTLLELCRAAPLTVLCAGSST